MRCKTDGEKEDRGPDGDVGIEENNGSESKNVGLEKKDAMNRARWRTGCGEITARVG